MSPAVVAVRLSVPLFVTAPEPSAPAIEAFTMPLLIVVPPP